MKQMFESFDQAFNDYKSYSDDQLGIYRISMPQAMNPAFRHQLSFLMSHISTDTSIVRFNTLFTEKPVADIYYIKEKVNEDKIYSALSADTLTVHYSGGRIGKVINPFKFKEMGKILKAE
jgi:hypothetical protein